MLNLALHISQQQWTVQIFHLDYCSTYRKLSILLGNFRFILVTVNRKEAVKDSHN